MFLSLSLTQSQKTLQIESLAKSKKGQLKIGRESLDLGEQDILCQFERLVRSVEDEELDTETETETDTI